MAAGTTQPVQQGISSLSFGGCAAGGANGL